MLKTKRNKKNKLFLPLLLLGFFLFFLVLFFLVGIFIPLYFGKSSFISPIPLSFVKERNNFIFSKNNLAKDLEAELSKNKIPFILITDLNNSSYLVKLEGNEEVAFSKNKSFALQVSSLQLMLSRLTIEGKRFTRLDLRFDKPIIVFKE